VDWAVDEAVEVEDQMRHEIQNLTTPRKIAEVDRAVEVEDHICLNDQVCHEIQNLTTPGKIAEVEKMCGGYLE
jgi:hypothetical protein